LRNEGARPVYGLRAEISREPSAGRAQCRSQRAPDPLPRAWARRRLEQDDLAWLLRMDKREPGTLERQRALRAEEMVVPVPVLGDPQRPAQAFDAGARGIVETDDLARFKAKLGAIEAEIHGRLLSWVTYCAMPFPQDQLKRSLRGTPIVSTIDS
jgi:hypothetical protein